MAAIDVQRCSRSRPPLKLKPTVVTVLTPRAGQPHQRRPDRRASRCRSPTRCGWSAGSGSSRSCAARTAARRSSPRSTPSTAPVTRFHPGPLPATATRPRARSTYPDPSCRSRSPSRPSRRRVLPERVRAQQGLQLLRLTRAAGLPKPVLAKVEKALPDRVAVHRALSTPRSTPRAPPGAAWCRAASPTVPRQPPTWSCDAGPDGKVRSLPPSAPPGGRHRSPPERAPRRPRPAGWRWAEALRRRPGRRLLGPAPAGVRASRCRRASPPGTWCSAPTSTSAAPSTGTPSTPPPAPGLGAPATPVAPTPVKQHGDADAGAVPRHAERPAVGVRGRERLPRWREGRLHRPRPARSGGVLAGLRQRLVPGAASTCRTATWRGCTTCAVVDTFGTEVQIRPVARREPSRLDGLPEHPGRRRLAAGGRLRAAGDAAARTGGPAARGGGAVPRRDGQPGLGCRTDRAGRRAASRSVAAWSSRGRCGSSCPGTSTTPPSSTG